MILVKLLWLLAFFSSMARTKITPSKGEKGKPKKVKTRAEVHIPPEKPPVPVEPPMPEEEAPPTQSERERRAEAEKLGVGRLLESLLTRELTQIGAEARPSMLGREEPARKKLTNHGRQGSLEGIPLGWESEKAPEVPAGVRSASFGGVLTSLSANYPFHN